MHSLFVLGVFLGIWYRACKMSPDTPWRAVLQHRIALLLAVASLPIFQLGKWSPVLLAGAFCAYLLLDPRRRIPRGGPPSQLDHEDMHHVAGGKRP